MCVNFVCGIWNGWLKLIRILWCGNNLTIRSTLLLVNFFRPTSAKFLVHALLSSLGINLISNIGTPHEDPEESKGNNGFPKHYIAVPEHE